MSTSKKLVVYNSIAGLSYQVIVLILQFIERKIFISFLGVEILGINSSLTAIIAVASLAEGGMGSAIIYHLYKPLKDDDYHSASSLLGVYRRIYHLISLGIMILSLCCIPFLGVFLSGVQININVYIYFILIAINTAASYLISYKRCIFTADRKDYLCKVVDGATFTVFTVLKIISVLIFRSFVIYLLVAVLQTVCSNFIIQLLCSKRYPQITKSEFEIEKFKKLLPEFKDLFAGQLVAYLFNSSDSIIISSFVSTVSVGLLSGYTMVTKSVKILILSIFGSFGSIIGRVVASTIEKDIKRENAFRMYCFSIYLISTVILIPEYVLLQDFVRNIWGTDYIMPNMIVLLLIAEQYITLIQDPCGVYIVANGEFKKCRNADAVAAITNIVSSLILVQYWGIEGVLIGTIISRIFQWLVKAYYVNISSLKRGLYGLLKYWLNNLYKLLCAIFALFISLWVYPVIAFNSFIIRFVVVGCISVAISFIVVAVSSLPLRELKLTVQFLLDKKR